MSIETVIPPAPPKPAAPVVPDTSAADAAAAKATADAAAEAAKAIDTSKMSLAEKIQHAAKGAVEKKADAPAPAAKKEEVKTDPESDAALDQEVAQAEKDGKLKKAVTLKTYALRDANRKVKELEGKITAAEAAGKNTTELETKLAAAEAKATDAETKLQAASAVDPAELTALKEKLTAAEKRQAATDQELQVAAVERSDEWKSAITKPKEKIAEQIAELAKKHEINPRSLQNALYGTAEEQAAAVEALTGPEQAKFFNLAIRAQEIDERADTLRTNAATANEKILARRTAETEQQKTERQSAFKTASKEAWASIEEAFPFLTPADGATEWNKSVADAEAFATGTDVASLDAKAASQILARAAVVPHLRGALQAKETALTEMQTELDAAKATIAKFEANKPGAEITPKDGEDTKPVIQATGAKGTALRIQQAIGGVGR